MNRQIQDWVDGKWGTQNTKQVSAELISGKESDMSVVQPVEAELGLLDLVEIVQEKLTDGTLSLTRMSDAITELGQKVSDNTAKFQEAIANSDLAKAKLIVNYIAEVMEDFSMRMDAELPIFSGSYSSVIDGISRSAALWESDFRSEDKSTIQTNHDQLAGLAEVIGVTFDSMSQMQQTISVLPRLTAAFNKAKTHAYQALVNFNRELSSARNLTEETQKELRRILDRN